MKITKKNGEQLLQTLNELLGATGSLIDQINDRLDGYGDQDDLNAYAVRFLTLTADANARLLKADRKF